MMRITVFGVTGRMGQAVLRALETSGDFTLCGATASSLSASLGQHTGAAQGSAGVAIVADPVLAVRGADVAVDFSQAAAVRANLAACVCAGVPLVIAVTGLGAGLQTDIDAAGERIAVLPAANTSPAAAVMDRLAGIAARSLPGYDIEITEAHHRHKRDAPSGTALGLGESVARARGARLADTAVFERRDGEARRPGQIGFSVIRAGEIVGVHSVLLAGCEETLEITHRVTDRQCFARGALGAARWLAGQSAGVYRMQDMLGIAD